MDWYWSDVVQAIPDPYREAHAFGLAVEFTEDGTPHDNLLAQAQALEDASAG